MLQSSGPTLVSLCEKPSAAGLHLTFSDVTTAYTCQGSNN